MLNYLIALATIEFVLLIVLAIIILTRPSCDELLKEQEINFIQLQNEQRDTIPMLVHELRAPLSVIKGGTELILHEKDKLSSQQIETLIGQMKDSSSGLLKMVNDILDVSKMEAGKFEIEKQDCSINNLLKEECGYYNSLVEIEGLKLKIDLQGDIPQFKCDPDRIKQVLNNLISNAIKFTPEGGNITVVSRRTDGDIIISVCDTGIGIPNKDKSKLFHKFVQISSHKDIHEKGTGLGLVISKAIVEAHGGKIWVKDNVPKGTCFEFSLPIE